MREKDQAASDWLNVFDTLFLLDIRVYCFHVVFIVPSPLKYWASVDLPTDH